MKITPQYDCPYCNGTGIVYDSVPWGSTTAQMPSYCNCVEEQIPEDFDGDIEIEEEYPFYVRPSKEYEPDDYL